MTPAHWLLAFYIGLGLFVLWLCLKAVSLFCEDPWAELDADEIKAHKAAAKAARREAKRAAKAAKRAARLGCT